MAMTEPDTLHAILSAVADAVGTYVGYQIDAGAQCVQIFDSWGGQLPPHMWEVWSKPYIQRVVDKVRRVLHAPGRSPCDRVEDVLSRRMHLSAQGGSLAAFNPDTRASTPASRLRH
jgi:uroporphyrinogen-III decarboxylase